MKNLDRSSWPAIVGAPTCASPVQPFFSYIGVSVGIPCRLLRTVRRIMRSNCSNSGSLHRNSPTSRTSECTTRIVTVPVPAVPTSPSNWT